MLLYLEAFRRLDIQFTMKYYPSKRCAIMANMGKVDGLPERVEDFNTAYPDLRRVEVPIEKVVFTAYANNTNIKVDGWGSLANMAYRVDYRIGVKKCEEKLPGLVAPEKLTGISKACDGLKRLVKGISHLYIDVSYIVESHLQDNEIDHSTIVNAGILEVITTFMFLHKKHELMIPKVEKVLLSMKEEGLFEMYKANVND